MEWLRNTPKWAEGNVGFAFYALVSSLFILLMGPVFCVWFITDGIRTQIKKLWKKLS